MSNTRRRRPHPARRSRIAAGLSGATATVVMFTAMTFHGQAVDDTSQSDAVVDTPAVSTVAAAATTSTTEAATTAVPVTPSAAPNTRSHGS